MPITPFLSRAKSLSSNLPSDTRDSPPPRASASTVFPSLQRLNTSQSATRISSTSSTSLPSQPVPLISFKLSAPSFLDAVVHDRADKQPVYIIQTVYESSSIFRLDHSKDRAVKAATIHWPTTVTRSKSKSGRTIQMADGRWRDAEDLLKAGPLGGITSRKFNVPHYPHPFKWKFNPGGHFHCTTAGANGPFAILDTAILNAPARLSIFHNCLRDEQALQQENYKTVPVLLLDYLIATAFLLSTDVQEWHDRPQSANGTVRVPGSSKYAVQRWLAIINSKPPPPASPSSPTEGTSLTSRTPTADNQTPSTTTSSSPRAAPAPDVVALPTPLSSAQSSLLSPGNNGASSTSPLPDLSQPSQPDGPSRAISTSSQPPLPPFSQLQSQKSPLRPPLPPPRRIVRQLPTPPTPLQPRVNPPWQLGEISRLPDIPTVPSVPKQAEINDQRPPSPSAHSSTSSGSNNSHRSLPHSRGHVPVRSASLVLPQKLAQEFATSSSPPNLLPAQTSSLRAANPDPLTEEEQEQMRQFNKSALSSQQQHLPHPPPRITRELPRTQPTYATGSPQLQIRDSGPIRIQTIGTPQPYAESVYELPPPAYNAIDFNAAPHIILQQTPGPH